MPKLKSEMMKRLRKERSAQGLVEYRAWVSPETKVKLEKLTKKLEKVANP